jgi:hypothetical protein
MTKLPMCNVATTEAHETCLPLCVKCGNCPEHCECDYEATCDADDQPEAT